MKRFALVVESDPHGAVRSREIGQPLFLDGEVSIGRDRAHASLIIEADTVSRRHCVFRRRGDAWFVEDAGSTGGTFVNDRRVVGSRLMWAGDRLVFGRVVVRFDAVDVDPLARVRRLGSWLALDADRLGERGVRRAFQAGGRVCTVVTSLETDPELAPAAAAHPMVPRLLEQVASGDGEIIHRAYDLPWGVRAQRISDTADGALDDGVSARIRRDVLSVVEHHRPHDLLPDVRDVVVSWDGVVRLLPVHLRRGADFAYFERSLVRAFGEGAGEPADNDALAAVVRGLFPAEHAADHELLEQIGTLDDAGVRWLLTR